MRITKSCDRSVSIINDRNRLLHCVISQKSIIISDENFVVAWVPGMYEALARRGWLRILVIPSTMNWKSCGRCSLPKK